MHDLRMLYTRNAIAVEACAYKLVHKIGYFTNLCLVASRSISIPVTYRVTGATRRKWHAV